MLKANRQTLLEAEKKSGLTTRVFAARLGVELRTYIQKVAESTNPISITLKDILIAQDLSGIPIEKFFTTEGEEITNHE